MKSNAYKARFRLAVFCAIAGLAAALLAPALHMDGDRVAVVGVVLATMVPCTWLIWRLLVHGLRAASTADTYEADRSWSLFDLMWGASFWVLALSNLALALDSLLGTRLLTNMPERDAATMMGIGVACALPAYEFTGLGWRSRRKWRERSAEEARIATFNDEQAASPSDRLYQAICSALIGSAAATALLDEINAGHVGIGLLLPIGIVALMSWRTLVSLSSFESKLKELRAQRDEMPIHIKAARPRLFNLVAQCGGIALGASFAVFGLIAALHLQGLMLLGTASLALLGVLLFLRSAVSVWRHVQASNAFHRHLTEIGLPH